MSNRERTVGAVVVLFSLPVLLAMANAFSFYRHNRPNGFMVSSGEKRHYVIHVPQSYDGSRPVALVISLHGAGGWGTEQMELSRWGELADREGFIAVFPSGADAGGPRIWREGGKDVRFISELIDTIETSYNIDRTRIYANGFSNGGGMAFVLSCALSDRIAAVGMVGAAQTLPWTWCTDDRPVPMIDFHGTDDHWVPYGGGASAIGPRPFPNVARWAAKWAQRNRCAPKPVESAFAPDVTRREYVRCAGGATVVLYTIRGGGHTWPGGQPLPAWFVGPTSRGIDATRAMWSFFRAHPLAGPAAVRGLPSSTVVPFLHHDSPRLSLALSSSSITTTPSPITWSNRSSAFRASERSCFATTRSIPSSF